MGSGSSRLGSRPSRPRLNRRFSSLICGGSTSRASPEIEDCPAELLVNSTEHNHLVTVEQSSTKESLLTSSAATAFTSPRTEIGTSSESSSVARENTSFINGLNNIETSNRGKHLSESKELIPPHLESDEPSQVNPYRQRSDNIASASFKDLHPLDPVPVNARADIDAANNASNLMDKDRSHSIEGVIHSSSSHASEQRSSYSDGASAGNHVTAVTAVDNPSYVAVPAVTNSPVSSHSQGNESNQEVMPAGLGIVVSDRADRERGRRDGSVFHVDVVSISSNIVSSTTAEVSNREARRNSRRLFWDAFSRRSSRRHSDSPTIVFSTDDTDDLGSHDRWLLDFSGDFFEDGVGGDSGYMGSRIHSMNERRWHSRSEIWERLRGGLDEGSRRTTTCPTGLHPDGMCSCDSLMAEESSTRASISRIVMLAEALFEVLDEIHRQPVSLSLSMVSLPAPESVVDSFPLKNHKKAETAESGEDVEQCYICLAEYEEGDKIRVLPCHHEYHMSCVDKWLKEIHGVCPLCRGDVREGLTGGSSVANLETPSL